MRQHTTATDTDVEPFTRPVLAPSTWLVGQLQESALENPPWAVEQPRRGYVEMSELAYRVAEQANGEQTVDEIATAVSTALRRPISAVDVEALIDTVLIPRGVMQGANGVAHQDDADDDPEDADPADRLSDNAAPVWGRPSRSPRPATARGVRRERIVGPKRLEAVASVLMWLFWPPVMLVLAALAVAALAWLVGIHGLAQSLIHVLAVPVLLPVMLIVAALGMATGGIGPMVALYSSGATLQRLRISTHVPRPRFTLDVADDYGFSRGARLLVNVSGVYLQLVVVLILCALGRAFDWEFLFLAAALITLNVIRLLVPFGRTGADRLLADWLLVQHPLRYAAQALGRLIPGAAPDQTVRPLKRWGRLAIGVYLGVMTVVLVVVTLVLLRTPPTIVATLFVALRVYLSGLVEAVGERDVLAFLEALFNTAVLVLSVFGVVVALIVLARSALTSASRWSQETAGRRLVGLVGAAVLAALLLVSWVPVRGFGTNGSPRSLAGVPFRSLSELSRGTLFDLFGGAEAIDTSGDQSGERPVITNDIGGGPVGGPLPDQATPGTGAAGAGAASNTGGTTSSAPGTGTPAARPPGAPGDATPEPRNGGGGTPSTAGQSANEPGASGTSSAGAAPDGASPGQVPGGAGGGPPGLGTAGPGAAPAARGTADAAGAPAGRATSGTTNGPAGQATAGPNGQSDDEPGTGSASKPTTGPGSAGQPGSNPTSGVVVQPVNRPTVSTAGQPANGSTGASGAGGQPARKPTAPATRAPFGPSSAQNGDDDGDADGDALDVTPGPAAGAP